MKKLFFIFTIFCLPSFAFADESINIGWIGPLTGDAAFLGIDSVSLVKEVFEEANAKGGINGQKIKLFINDDRMETPAAISAYKQLVQINKVKVIFIFNYGGMLALAKEAERDGVLLINPLDCDENLAALPPNSFCVAKKTEDIAHSIASHIIKNNLSPSAVIYLENDTFKPLVAKTVKEKLAQAGKDTVLFQGVLNQAADLKPLIIQAKNKNAQSLFIIADTNFCLGFKQAKQLGFKGQLYGLATLTASECRKLAGDAIDGSIIANWLAPRTEKYLAFLEEFKKKYGREPIVEIATIPSYDLSHILLTGLKSILNNNPKIEIEELRAYLYQLKDYDGLSGTLSMDPDGAVRSLKVGTYLFEAGNLKEIY